MSKQVRDFTEIERLAAAEKLEDLLLVGNPIYNDYKDNNTLADYRVEVRAIGPRLSHAVLRCAVHGQGASSF